MPGTPDKVLSRDFQIAINTGTIGSPVWTPILGLDDDGIVYSESHQTASKRTAADGGWERPWIIGRGAEFKLKGSRFEASDDGTRDPGQAAVEALGRGMVSGARGQFKMTSPAAATPEVLTFYASVVCVPAGGGEFSSWEATLLVDGEPARS